jgi:hypothetical protein
MKPKADTNIQSNRKNLPITSNPMEQWPTGRSIPYARNPRQNDGAVDRMCASIREFGFKIPCLVRSDGEVVDGHLRLKAAQKLQLPDIPVILCDEWTKEQVKAFRLLVNRSATWADWDEELLARELEDLQKAEFDLSLTGFDLGEIDTCLSDDAPGEDEVPRLSVDPVSRVGDLWLCGSHRVLCGDAINSESVRRLLGGRSPLLLVTDPPHDIELDAEWRDRAELSGNGRPGGYVKRQSKGHSAMSISGDTRADWSEAFGLVVSLQVGYVWHAARFTREVLNGLLGIGFEHHQQIIWDRECTALPRTHYWSQHEPCWYVRKKKAPWYGKAGDNSTIWKSPPKFIMGDSDREKFDHPGQKPVELMRRPILNHTKPSELVYDPFLGSGTTLMAAELTSRGCCGIEIDPRFVDVLVERWQVHTGAKAILEGDGCSFESMKAERTTRVLVSKQLDTDRSRAHEGNGDGSSADTA